MFRLCLGFIYTIFRLYLGHTQVLATNANDILHELVATGSLVRRSTINHSISNAIIHISYYHNLVCI